MNFANFLRTPFSQNTSWQLLLYFDINGIYIHQIKRTAIEMKLNVVGSDLVEGNKETKMLPFFTNLHIYTFVLHICLFVTVFSFQVQKQPPEVFCQKRCS